MKIIDTTSFEIKLKKEHFSKKKKKSTGSISVISSMAQSYTLMYVSLMCVLSDDTL